MSNRHFMEGRLQVPLAHSSLGHDQCQASGPGAHLLTTWLLRCRLNMRLQRLMVLRRACLKGRQSHCSQPLNTLVFSHLDTSSYSFS